MKTRITNGYAPRSIVIAAALIALLLPGAGHAAEAGKIEFLVGDVKVISSTGSERRPIKGEIFDAGDTVVSKEARVQLRFTDGAFISLAPHSRFHIKEYTYAGAVDGTEKVTMELLRGALRTITGLIGKKNKAAYLMQTSVATIGIRGTEYSISYGGGITGTVSRGAIAVCNVGGCVDVTKDQSYFVRDAATKPVLTEKAVFLPPPQPGKALANYLAQNEAEEDTEALSTTGGDGEGKNKDKSAKEDTKGKGDANKKSKGELLSSEVSSDAQEKTKDKKEKAPKAENVKGELTSADKKQSGLDKVSEGKVNGKAANNPGVDKKEMAISEFSLFTSIGANLESKSSDTAVDSPSNNTTGKLDQGGGTSAASQSPDQANSKPLSAPVGDIGLASTLDESGKVKKIKLDDIIFGDVGNGKKAPKLR